MILTRTFLSCIILSVLIQTIKNFSTVNKDLDEDKVNNDYLITLKTGSTLNYIERKTLKQDGISNVTNNNNTIIQSYPSNSENTNENNQKPMQNLKLYDGDIMLKESQAQDIMENSTEQAKESGIDVSSINQSNKTRDKRKITIVENQRWSFPIRYYVDHGVDSTLVDKGVKLIETETCVRFKKSNNPYDNRPGLRYYYGEGCWSYVGKIQEDSFQDVSIGKGCNELGIVQHETLHAVGLNHEQCRTDRDSYLKIYINNARQDMIFNFLKISPYSTSTYNIKYDPGSIMHYDVYAFSENGKKTMKPINPIYENTLGQITKISFADAKIVNLHYCSDSCKKTLKCFNGGYQNPNNCDICKCADGFSGKFCDEIPYQNSGCPSTCHNVLSQSKSIEVSGAKNCIIHLRANINQKIKLVINNVQFTHIENVCKPFNNLEVKYMSDKIITGARFCEHHTNIPIVSENHHIVLLYSSKQYSSSFKVTFSKY